MVTLKQLCERVSAKVILESQPWTARDEDVVLATVLQLGMYVTKDGEVGDPRPGQAPAFPQQRNVRFRGRRRR
jgi:hypothetical protein